MSAYIHFDVQTGQQQKAESYYLPFGTRTLRLVVTNQTGSACLLWLRPTHTPTDYPAWLVHGYGDEDEELWVHWAGGEEWGAAVNTAEKRPLRDRSLKIWEVIPIPLEAGQSRSVFINISHHSGPLRPRTLTLQALTMINGREQLLDSQLQLRLVPPTVNDPVHSVWDHIGSWLTFQGSQVAEYVSRWWPGDRLEYHPADDLPGRLALQQQGDQLTLTLGADRQGLVTLATVKDHDWVGGQAGQSLRLVTAELFHFCDQRYYVVRLWFLWLDKRIGRKHEVPDAERIDVLFDRRLAPEPVPALGTDFHYRETWGRLQPRQMVGRIELGLGISSLDDFAFRNLVNFLNHSQVANPARAVAEQLCGVVRWQKGPIAHVPLLTNVDLFRHMTSGDVRSD